VAPTWFDRLNQPVDNPAARTGTDPAQADPSKTGSSNAEPRTTELPEATPFKAAAAKTSPADDYSSTATAAAADASDVDTDDDDWPTRYSWLEDEETDEADGTADAADVTDAAETVAAETVAVKAVAPETVAAKTVPEEAKAAEPVAADAGSLDAAAPPDADAEDHHPVTADDAYAAADSAAEAAESGETPAAEAADEDEDAPPAPPGSGARLVTVIPGVPRYHDPDCILIRFMDEEDIARKSIPEAKAANCTPCAACQPEG
jgi:hypothetical protein